MKHAEFTGYISKAGKNGLYKIVARFTTTEGVNRVKLETMGDKPLQFWADEAKLCAPPMPEKRGANEHTRKCWECGCDFTWRECKANDGEWSDFYCGC